MLIKIKEKLNKYFWHIIYKLGNHLKLVAVEPSLSFIDAKDQLTGSVAEYMRMLNKTQIDGFCYRLDYPNIIEPSLSCSIVGFNKIIGGSLIFMALRPSALKYLQYRFLKRGRKINVDAAVLFDGQLGTNYFHFFADVFNKLWLLDYYNIDRNTPLIISKKTFNTTYFQYLYKATEVSSFNWLVQDEQDFIKCQTLFLIKPVPYNKLGWKKTLALMDGAKSSKQPFRRLFITRPGNKGRGLSNMENIMPIINRYGFDVIDPGLLDFEEQVKIFSEAEIIIGLHGAALTNIMFASPQKVKVLEIGPLYRITGQFYWLALTLNIKYYNCILGSEMINSQFEISVAVFENALTELLVA